MDDVYGDQPEFGQLSFRERLPDYLAVFGIGFAGSVVVGLVISLIWKVKVSDAVGYTMAFYGVLLLLAGGATGGGYTSLGVGAAGALFGARRTDEASDDIGNTWSEKAKKSPQDRLREGLRPEANPRAFWQVFAGFLYIGLGVVIAALLG
jgi:hypothetical protein